VSEEPAEPQDDQLVGVGEIAKLAGVTSAAVANWRARGTRGFPAPLHEGKNGPLYRLVEVLAWLERRPARGTAKVQPLLGIESSLWSAADKLRGSVDASQYRHVVLTLLFLRRVLTPGATPLGMTLPQGLSWASLRAASDDTLNAQIQDAIAQVEHANPSLAGVLPQVFATSIIDGRRLRGLIEVISNVGEDEAGLRDQLGRAYEYFLGRFAAADGRSGGEFYTPSSVVRLLAEVVQPLAGTLYDPCCGSGGMFVQSARVKEAHAEAEQLLHIVGQELNDATWRLAKMNLALHDLKADLGEGPADTFHQNQHPGLEADYVLANPPFNISDWGVESLLDDQRWAFGTPPNGNANLAWVQHIWAALSARGRAGIVLANGTSSSDSPAESAIRAGLVASDAIECMIALPSQLFYSTTIPVTLWFLAKDKSRAGREGSVLFIDARGLGEKVTRSHRELSDDDVGRIVACYESWVDGAFVEDPGFATVATVAQIEEAHWSLVPSHYVAGVVDEVEGETLEQLVAEYRALQGEAITLDDAILGMLSEVTA
jgi:type I restriction enzyme M protein